MNVSKSDIKKLIETIIEDYHRYEDGDYDKSQCVCNYCEGKSPAWVSWRDHHLIEHRDDCAYMLALRISEEMNSDEDNYLERLGV